MYRGDYKALDRKEGEIAALKALRHPKAGEREIPPFA
jgi:hypothetical protein